MRKENYTLKAVKIIWNVAILVFLVIAIVQFNNVQKRLIKIEKHGISIQNGSQNYTSQTTKKNKDFGVSKNRKWLNPGLPNQIITNKPLYTLPQNQNYNTKILARTRTEDKSYNDLIENSANVAEYSFYVGCGFSARNWDNVEDWIGKVAERIELLDDEKTFIVYLKKGVKWHKPAVDLSDPKYAWLGKDHFVTAHDVKFTVDTILNPQVEAGSLRNYYQDLESVDVIDDHTVRFKWKKKLFTAKSATLGFAFVPEFLYAYNQEGTRYPKETFGLKFNNHWYNNNMIGCGAYRWKEHKDSAHIILERNEDYFIGLKPVPKTIKYIFIKDDNLSMLKLNSGELSAISKLSETVYRDEIVNKDPRSNFQNGKLNYKLFPRLIYYYIGWNLSHPIFQDKLVRQAMTHSFDRERVLKSVLMDLGQVVTGPFPPSLPAYDKSIKPYSFDLKKAAKLLKKAGWEDKNGDGILEKEINGKIVNFEFTTMLLSFPIYKTMYSMFKENLIKIGVKMNLSIVDWAVFLKKLEDKNFDAFNGAWALGVETDLYQIWHSSQADVPRGSNRIDFRNAQADEIIEKVRITFDQKKRIKLFHEFHKIMHEEQPYTFLFNRKGVAGYQSYIENYITRIQRPHTQYLTLSADK